jgi:hypothetical protein
MILKYKMQFQKTTEWSRANSSLLKMHPTVFLFSVFRNSLYKTTGESKGKLKPSLLQLFFRNTDS